MILIFYLTLWCNNHLSLFLTSIALLLSSDLSKVSILIGSLFIPFTRLLPWRQTQILTTDSRLIFNNDLTLPTHPCDLRY